MERLRSARKPMAGVFLTAEWRNLLMVNFGVDPQVLRPYVPAGTEIDTFEGQTFVSLVGFRFTRTRVLGAPVPLHRDFDEVNLRFYVRRETGGDLRQGVVFVKEIVPRRAIAAVARLLYQERYVRLPMRSTVQVPGRVAYEWQHDGAWDRLAAVAAGTPARPAPGSKEAFITEHYWGYVRQRDGGTVEYRVEHPPWRVYRCEAAALTCRAAALYGERFADALGAAPDSAFLAEGSPVAVRHGERL